jgi:hypothetical protein
MIYHDDVIHLVQKPNHLLNCAIENVSRPTFIKEQEDTEEVLEVQCDVVRVRPWKYGQNNNIHAIMENLLL